MKKFKFVKKAQSEFSFSTSQMFTEVTLNYDFTLAIKCQRGH